MVPGLELAVVFLIAWFARKAGRAGKRLDSMADEVMDAGLGKLHDVIVAKLGGDSAVKQLETEVAETGEAGTRTQTRVRLALEEAAEQDKAFAADLQSALATLRTGDHSIAVGRDVRADSGMVIMAPGGQVSVAPPNPPRPGGRSPRT
jgi:hypothetical protein